MRKRQPLILQKFIHPHNPVTHIHLNLFYRLCNPKLCLFLKKNPTWKITAHFDAVSVLHLNTQEKPNDTTGITGHMHVFAYVASALVQNTDVSIL